MYTYIIVRTHRNMGEASNKNIRVSPLPGQGFDENLRVACSAADRSPDSLLKIKVALKDRLGTPYLYSHYSWYAEPVSEEEAYQFIKENF